MHNYIESSFKNVDNLLSLISKRETHMHRWKCIFSVQVTVHEWHERLYDKNEWMLDTTQKKAKPNYLLM